MTNKELAASLLIEAAGLLNNNIEEILNESICSSNNIELINISKEQFEKIYGKLRLHVDVECRHLLNKLKKSKCRSLDITIDEFNRCTRRADSIEIEYYSNKYTVSVFYNKYQMYDFDETLCIKLTFDDRFKLTNLSHTFQ